MTVDRLILWLVILGVLVVNPRPAWAQQEPVYAVYDGFLTTDDGLYVVAFAYFSHNFEPVTIPVGPQNTFGPDPVDRRQPTRFLPGHHRFQCVMVMGAEFAGDLEWTVGHAGTTSATSRDMLQYNWELEDRSVATALRGVDTTVAPRGVCLNRPPTIRFLGLRNGPDGAPPEVTTALDGPLKLFGSVRDEGLPREEALRSEWRVLRGPGPVAFSAADEPRTLASFEMQGEYELELWAGDGEYEARGRVVVHVTGAP